MLACTSYPGLYYSGLFVILVVAYYSGLLAHDSSLHYLLTIIHCAAKV